MSAARSRRGSKGGKGGKDLKYFTSTKKGEIHEFKAELHSPDRTVMKDAVKKVIAALTVGKDMSPLFPDVVSCMQTDDLELKKLVYLYLINYAKSNPEMAIMVVNTFVKDSSHPSPLIRALAVRTMGCIRVDRITEYLCDPLKRALADEDPYVKKTAAVCVAKLHDISPELVRDQGFIETLRDLICDANPTVVANAVAALAEIKDSTGRDVFEITSAVLQKLLAALNECTEWGQVFILDALAAYTPGDAREAESVIERVLPRLNHQNSAVVLSAVKIVMKYMVLITNADTVSAFSRKLTPSLVTLSQNRQPEIQYVALRNISLIVQRRPLLLAHKIKVFFCKYNDPIYVKMEKLEILVKLAQARNIEQVLAELKEYASEVDVDFVRKAVRTIGRCAIKLEGAAERCIKVLLDLIQTKVNYVVQEAVVVIKDIFRRYPNRYESVISILCDALGTLDEPEAKASMIWIIGEYAGRIENADELLDSFLETFHDETAAVQLQLLTAIVKLFLRKPEEKGTDALVQRVLNMATVESDNPDLRDRGYVYWRLLCADADAARSVVLAEKPVIADDTGALDPALLDSLIGQLSTLASVYHKPPEAFVTRTRHVIADADTDSDSDDGYALSGGEEGDEESKGEPVAEEEPDLLGLGGFGGGAPAPAPAPVSAAPAAAGDFDLFGDPTPAPAAAAAPVELPELATQSGLTIRGRVVRKGGKAVLESRIDNAGTSVVGSCVLKFKPNRLGVCAESAAVSYPSIAPGGSGSVDIPLLLNPSVASADPIEPTVMGAMRDNTTGSVLYFGMPLPLQVFFSGTGPMDRTAFIATWKGIPPATGQLARPVKDLPSVDIGVVAAKLGAANAHLVARRPFTDDQELVYFSAQLSNGDDVLVETTWKPGFNACRLCVRSVKPEYLQSAWNALSELLLS